MDSNLSEVQDQLKKFVKERDWEKFHTPKNLTMSLIVESAELVEIFQWLSSSESRKLDDATLGKVKDEIADIFIYLVRLCDVLNVDLFESAFEKIKKNKIKYPSNLVKGSAKKYTDLDYSNKGDNQNEGS